MEVAEKHKYGGSLPIIDEDGIGPPVFRLIFAHKPYVGKRLAMAHQTADNARLLHAGSAGMQAAMVTFPVPSQ